MVNGWNATWCWIRYLFVGARNGVRGLVDFVLGNHFFTAIQVASELTALGEILAARRPERALEIGTARGGTLLFVTRLASLQATIISVDRPGGKFSSGYGRTRARLYKRFARRAQRLQLLQGNSHSRDMLGRVKAALGGGKNSTTYSSTVTTRTRASNKTSSCMRRSCEKGALSPYTTSRSTLPPRVVGSRGFGTRSSPRTATSK
jgi:hypothetical protein